MLIQVSAPAVLAISEQEVWEHLRVVLRELDAFEDPEPADRAHILRLMQAAVDALDGPDGYLSRCLIEQGWLFFPDAWPRVIEVPLPPLRSVTSVRYIAPSGEWKVLDPASYTVSGVGASAKGEIAPAPGKAWPVTASVSRPVEIQFKAGYGETPEQVPAAIRGALLEAIATAYAYRESVVMGSVASLPASAAKALDRFRVFV